jgi:ribosomal protein S18 acetylase RimI-like enzyme
MVIVRQATLDDIPKIKIINEQSLAENYSLWLWNDLFELENSRTYVAEETDQIFQKNIIGYIISVPYVPMFTFGEGTTKFIDEQTNSNFNLIASFAVLDSHRGKGTGQQLMTKLLNDNGNEMIMLNVRISNLAAIKLYEKNNFVKHITIDENYYGNPTEDAYLMVRMSKQLEQPIIENA